MNSNTSLITGIVVLIVVVGLAFYFWRPAGMMPYGNTWMNGPAEENTETGTGSGSTGGQTRAGAKPVAVTTGFASVSSTTAVVVGTVNPRGSATTYWFEYGPTANFGSTAAVEQIGSGSQVVGAAAYITGLKPATTYYFRLGAQNANGRSYGAVYSFITAAK